MVLPASGTSAGPKAIPPGNDPVLLSYWNFNNELDQLLATSGTGTITSFHDVENGIESGDEQGFAALNARDLDPAAFHLRVNNPIGAILTFAMSTQGHENIVMKYESRRSAQGAGTQRISYTLNGTDYLFFQSVNPVNGDPIVVTLDFTMVAGVADNSNFAVRVEFEQTGGGVGGNNRFDNVTLEGTEIPQIVLMHYWSFNEVNFANATETIGDASLTQELSVSSTLVTGDQQDFASLNGRNGDLAGNHLRLNTPIGSSLTFAVPTIGHENVVVKYETRRSGQGAEKQNISYTIDGASYIPFQTNAAIDGVPVVVTLDFTGEDAVNNNEHFAIRFEFEQGTNGGIGGNNRFDNLTVEGNEVTNSGGLAISLLAPANNATGLSLTPELSWEAPSDPVNTYRVQLSDDVSFNSTIIDQSSFADTEFEVGSPLTNGTPYYWRVMSDDPAGNWSSTRTFTTMPLLPGAVVLNAPAEEAMDQSVKPTFSWAAAAGAETYTLQLSLTADFSTLLDEMDGLTDVSTIYTGQLELGTTYYWRTFAVNLAGSGITSAAQSFTTVTTLPALNIRVNEVMGSNNGGPVDDDGENADWIELYNMGSIDVDMTGFGLTDAPANPFKWTFPAITLAAGEYMVIWASNKNRILPPSPLHTNFAVSAGGEAIVVTTATGVKVHQSPATAMNSDESYGLSPDGSGSWVLMTSPTPGASNASGLTVLTETVAFSHGAGKYSSPFDLILSADDPDATILYTIDGSVPKESAVGSVTYRYKKTYATNPGDPPGDFFDKTMESMVYTNPIHVDDPSAQPNQLAQVGTVHFSNWFYTPPTVEKAMVVRARIVKPGSLPGRVTTHTYFVRNSFDHDLAVISLSIDDNLMFNYDSGIYVPGKDFDAWRASHPAEVSHGFSNSNYHHDDELPGSFEFFEPGSLTRVVGQDVGLEISGNYSLFFPQKSLQVKANSGYGRDTIGYKMFEDRSHLTYKRLVLRNSGNDFLGTLFRDAFIQASVEHLQFGTQAYRPSIVFLNGEYWGIHNIREHYNKYYLESNFDVDPDNVDLIEVREAKEGDQNFYNSMIQYMENNELSEDQHLDHVATMMDVEGFMDYQIAEIYAANADWPGNNHYYWRTRNAYNPNGPKFRDGRIRWMVKDTDHGFGLATNSSHNTLEHALAIGSPSLANPDWATFPLRRLLENEGFKKRFINRFADLINSTFIPERLEGLVVSMKEQIAAEIPNHIARWNLPVDWEGKVKRIVDFSHERPDLQREHIRAKFGLPAFHELTLNVSHHDHGFITINTIDIKESTVGIASQPYPWTGKYFQDIPVTIRAVAASGYKFLKWEGAVLPEEEEITVNLTTALSIKAIFVDGPVFRTQPLNNTVVDQPITFNWLPVSNATGYDLQVSANSNFTSTLVDEPNIQGTTFNATTLFMNGSQHYWRIRLNGTTSWSEPWLFTTQDLAPELISPATDATDIAIAGTAFSWQTPGGGAAYDFELSEHADFSTTVAQVINVASTDLTLQQTLDQAKEYYWRVKLSSGELWSEVRSFTTMLEVPLAPELMSPAADATNISLTPELTWNAPAHTDFYVVQISEKADFVSVIELTSNEPSATLESPLKLVTSYYWRVRALNAAGASQWSEIRSFETLPPVPALTFPANMTIDHPLETTLTWTGSGTVTQYRVNVSADASFSTLLVDELVTENQLPVANLEPKTTYSWRVRASGPRVGDWSEAFVFTTAPVSGVDEEEKAKIVFYPNPVANELFVEWPSSLNVNLISVYNGLGQVVKSINVVAGAERMVIDFKEQSAGVFMIQVMSQNKIVDSARIVK
jgi:hypothetical protein